MTFQASVIRSTSSETVGQRFLVLSTSLPYPLNRGNSIRSWGIFTSLANAGHRLSLLALGDPSELDKHQTKLREVFTSVEVIPHRAVTLTGNPDYLRRVRAIGSATPYSALRFRSGQLRQRLSTLLSLETYDAIISDTLYPLVNLPESAVPVIISEHNMEHVLIERYIQNERNPLKKLYGFLESRRLQRWQAKAWSKAALVLVCSEQDRSILNNHCPGAAVAVVPNAIDLSRYRPSQRASGDYLLYTGTLDWYPNRDAVDYLLSEIFPTVKREFPAVTQVIAGRNPPAAFLKRYSALDGVTFLNSVPDMRPVIAGAAVVLVPLRIGSGTRVKILEAGAFAKPIVSTPIGAEGLNFKDGLEILIAGSPTEFAHSVVRLLRNADLQRRIGMAARCKVEESYGLDTLGAALSDALMEFRRRTPPPATIPRSKNSASKKPGADASPASEAVKSA